MRTHADEVNQLPIVPWIEFRDQSGWNDALHLGRKVTWNARFVVQRPEDAVASIFLLRSGTIKVAAASETGLQRTLWLSGPGSTLGEAAMFGHHPYMHHITVIEPCVAYEFSRRVVLEELLPRHPAVSVALISNLAAKCYVMSTQVEEITFLSVPQRLARFFYGLYLARGSERLPLSHADIGDLLGLHRVTVSRTISAMKRAGLLESDTHEIVVTDITALATFVTETTPQDMRP
ncbi:Crp/Fnr family transcriptional regulator [Paracoccus versutus]|nr:Crp/Fnr family transcriptional regulator [Paracoccus versutus]